MATQPEDHAAQSRVAALRHGHRANGHTSPTYNSWRAMLKRCLDPNHPFYQDYGGRGITVHPAWQGRGGFARFLADVGERPEGMTLDRIDVHGDYEPGNVRWADHKTQRWNRRDMQNPRIEFPDTTPARANEPAPF